MIEATRALRGWTPASLRMCHQEHTKRPSAAPLRRHHLRGNGEWFRVLVLRPHRKRVPRPGRSIRRLVENEFGVLNLGQIDYKILLADDPVTDEVKNRLIPWWAKRVEDLKLE